MGFRRPFNTKSKQPHSCIPHTSYLVKQRLYAGYGLLKLKFNEWCYFPTICNWICQ